MEDDKPDIMTATDDGKTYVVSRSMQDALARHSAEMAELRRLLKAAAGMCALALLGLLAILAVKWDVVMAVLWRAVG